MTGCLDTAQEKRRFYERFGMRPIRWFHYLERDLSDPLPDLPDLADLQVVGYRDDLDAAVRITHNAAFARHWGFNEWSAEDWRARRTGSHAFRPELSFVVLDGEKMVAYLVAMFWPADLAAEGYRTAYVTVIGTLPEYRGRGLASALIARFLHAARDAGYDRAGLDVDTENATSAMGVYLRSGFAPTKRSVLYGLDLAADGRPTSGP